MKLGDIGQRIAHKLHQAFSPSELEVIDDSGKHAGHAGARPEGETHFRVRIIAAAFEGKSRIDRHRMINKVLAEELAGPVHALGIIALDKKAVAEAKNTVKSEARIVSLSASDPAMMDLLSRAGLPTSDLGGTNKCFFGLRDGEALVAGGGLERHGAYGLVRSLVVAEDHRGLGQGKRIVNKLKSESRNLGLKELYLLTTTAEGFFDAMGFQRIGREAVPPEIRLAVEFRELCPASSTVMRYRL